MSGQNSQTPDMKWFTDAKFGMFIHWGLYSVPAGTWKGLDTPWVSEWIMRKYKIPVKEYETLAEKFNPVKFNAKEWVKTAKDAGMKYMVITSKHHEGFAMFHSKYDRYNIVDATPFGRDPLKELAEECGKAGIRLGFYYSQDQDWHEAGASGNNWDFRRGTIVKEIKGSIKWPEKWRVFGAFEPNDANIDRKYYKSLPETIIVNGKEFRGHDELFKNGEYDFVKVVGSNGQNSAFAFTKIHADNDTELTIGAGGDWYMEWRLDGEIVCSTMDKGNPSGDFSVANNVFNVKLSKGDHILSLRFVRGGFSGFMVCGGPDEVRKSGWTPVPGPSHEEMFENYLQTKVKTQLRELLTNYGPVALIWFDTPYMIKKEQSQDLKDFVHSLQPECLVSGRVGNGLGDYGSLGDNEVPSSALRGVWEGLGTTNDSWGVKTTDHEWKPPKMLLEIMSSLVSKNANYLLNVGPAADGTMPKEAVKNLRAAGRWLKVNGAAIYKAKPNPFHMTKPLWGYITEGDKRLHLIVFNKPSGEILLYGLRNKIHKVYLEENKKFAFDFEQDKNEALDYHRLAINIPKLKGVKTPFVITAEMDGPANVNPKAYHAG